MIGKTFYIELYHTYNQIGNPSPPLKTEWIGKNPSDLDVCQGDCDKDSECPGESICIKRTNGIPKTIDGCSLGDSGTLNSDYCNNPWGNVRIKCICTRGDKISKTL